MVRLKLMIIIIGRKFNVCEKLTEIKEELLRSAITAYAAESVFSFLFSKKLGLLAKDIDDILIERIKIILISKD